MIGAAAIGWSLEETKLSLEGIPPQMIPLGIIRVVRHKGIMATRGRPWIYVGHMAAFDSLTSNA